MTGDTRDVAGARVQEGPPVGWEGIWAEGITSHTMRSFAQSSRAAVALASRERGAVLPRDQGPAGRS
jgi:hypothetical protein